MQRLSRPSSSPLGMGMEVVTQKGFVLLLGVWGDELCFKILVFYDFIDFVRDHGDFVWELEVVESDFLVIGLLSAANLMGLDV